MCRILKLHFKGGIAPTILRCPNPPVFFPHAVGNAQSLRWNRILGYPETSTVNRALSQMKICSRYSSISSIGPNMVSTKSHTNNKTTPVVEFPSFRPPTKVMASRLLQLLTDNHSQSHFIYLRLTCTHQGNYREQPRTASSFTSAHTLT